MAGPQPMAGAPSVRTRVPPPLPERRALVEAGLLERMKPTVSNIAANLQALPRRAVEAVKALPKTVTDEVKAAAGSALFKKANVAINRPYSPPKEFSRNELKAALGFTESDGNPNAVSSAGARGLYQIMPKTAEWIAGKAGIPWKGEEALSDPKYNSKIADAYWDYLSKKYNNDLSLTLAAYNYGEGNLGDLIKKHKTKDMSVLFKHLPEETRKHHNITIGKLRFNRGE